MLKEKGYTNLLGLDPSPRCAAAAKRLYDIDVMVCTVADLVERPERYDLIIVVGVLEHIRDLDAAMSNMAGLLNPGGMIFAEVPDATEFYRWPDAPFQEFSTEHINFFSAVSLRNLFARHHMEEVLSEQCRRFPTATTVYPEIVGLYRRESRESRESTPQRLSHCNAMIRLSRLRNYIRESRRVEELIEAKIQRITSDQRPIIVWGVGTHTQRLMARGSLGRRTNRRLCGFQSALHRQDAERRADPQARRPEGQARTDPDLLAGLRTRNRPPDPRGPQAAEFADASLQRERLRRGALPRPGRHPDNRIVQRYRRFQAQLRPRPKR